MPRGLYLLNRRKRELLAVVLKYHADRTGVLSQGGYAERVTWVLRASARCCAIKLEGSSGHRPMKCQIVAGLYSMGERALSYFLHVSKSPFADRLP
jgi:hypothetical protein